MERVHFFYNRGVRMHWATSVSLSVAYIVPKSKTERPRKTHVTHDSDTTFKVKRSKVMVTRPPFHVRDR